MKRVILIDPRNQRVSEEHIDGSLDSIYNILDCSLITAIYPEQFPGDFLFLDDEGHFVPDQAFFSIDGYSEILAGKAIIMLDGPEGESLSTSLKVTDVAPLIKFYQTREEVLVALDRLS